MVETGAAVGRPAEDLFEGLVVVDNFEGPVGDQNPRGNLVEEPGPPARPHSTELTVRSQLGSRAVQDRLSHQPSTAAEERLKYLFRRR